MYQDYSSLLSGSSNISPVAGYNGNTMLGYDNAPLGGYYYNPPKKETVSCTKTNFKKENMQVKLAVFKVERDENGDVKSSTFLKEFWVERLPNVSVELLAVKELEPGFEPNDIVVKELLTIYL